MTVKKIAVIGRIRAGKNTFADMITNKYGHHQFQFGDGIKEVIMEYFPEALVSGKPRQHYQVIGQSFRQLNPNLWIEMLDRKLQNHFRFYPNYPVIIPDLRQPNEAEYLKQLGFTIIKLEADKEVRLDRIAMSGDVFSEEQLEHETEKAVDMASYDYLVSNNDSLEALQEQADFIMDELIKEYMGEGNN